MTAPSTRLAGIVAANYARSVPAWTFNHPVTIRAELRKAFFEGVRAAADLAAARVKWPDDPEHGRGGYHDNRRR